jgi:hypothetical protein
MSQVKKAKEVTKDTVTEEVEPKPSSTELIEESDELMDEIDRLLEETTVVSNYRQKGGQ